jgi:MFS family permease
MTNPLREPWGWRGTFAVGFILAVLFLLTEAWPLAVVAGVAVGVVRRAPRSSFLLGGTSVMLAWAGYLALLFLLFDASAVASLFGAIAGSEALGGVLVLLTLVVPFLLGAVGALVGAYFVQMAFTPVSAAPKTEASSRKD